MVRFRPALLATLVTAAIGLGHPLTVGASCAFPSSLSAAISAAPVTFIGTVTAVSSGGRVATVSVEDVWTGRVASQVQVVGSPDLSAAATSVDRTYSAGQKYLFVPSGAGPDGFLDNSCTQTQPYSSALASLRPAGAHLIPPKPTSNTPLSGTVLLGAVALAVIAVASILFWRRRLPIVSS